MSTTNRFFKVFLGFFSLQREKFQLQRLEEDRQKRAVLAPARRC
jgi:hypothetical protein